MVQLFFVVPGPGTSEAAADEGIRRSVLGATLPPSGFQSYNVAQAAAAADPGVRRRTMFADGRNGWRKRND
jgi:hypothetical protein